MDNLSDPNQLPKYGENVPVAWIVGESWDDGMDDPYTHQEISKDSSIGIGPKLLFIATLFGCAVVGLLLFYLTAEGNFSEMGARSKAASEGLNSPKVQVQPTKQASSAAHDEKTNCMVSEGYPGKVRRWCDLISKYSGRRGLPPDLVAAVILQESGGNPAAFSQSGAVGLMQVMPRDGLAASFLCANGPCFSDRPSSMELQDPDYNVSYGTKMLANLVGKHGDFREALRSYGPMDVGYQYADKVLGIYQSYGQ